MTCVALRVLAVAPDHASALHQLLFSILQRWPCTAWQWLLRKLLPCVVSHIWRPSDNFVLPRTSTLLWWLLAYGVHASTCRILYEARIYNSIFESYSDSDDTQQNRRLLTCLLCMLYKIVVLAQLNRPEGDGIIHIAAKSAGTLWPRTQKPISCTVWLVAKQ